LIPPPQVEYRTILLTQEQVAYVSPHRYEELNQFKWRALRRKKLKGVFYAVRHSPMIGGIQGPMVFMHRQILGLQRYDPREGDHKDHLRTLDNTDENLRVADDTQQGQNTGLRDSSTSGYKGVSWHKRRKAWQAYINVDRKNKHLGYYKTAYEAHLAYCYAAAYHFGEFACFE